MPTAASRGPGASSACAAARPSPEVAAYRTAIAMATAMGEDQCASILNENLSGELDMASYLETNAVRLLRPLAERTA